MERRLWKGFSNTATYEKMLDLLCKKNKQWEKCREGIEAFI